MPIVNKLTFDRMFQGFYLISILKPNTGVCCKPLKRLIMCQINEVDLNRLEISFS